MDKDIEKKEKSINQSNTISRAVIKLSSATAYKIIKFGTHKLDMKFRFEKTKLSLKEYKEMNLLDKTNWKNIDWDDFSCRFSISEFYEALGLSDGGKQRDEIKKMVTDIVKETVILEYENKDKVFPWFIEAEYEHDNNTVKNLSFIFNPGVIGAALVNNGEYYSHIELLVIGQIKSFYGLRIYELVKSFYNKKSRYGNEKGTWKTDWYSVDELKKFLQCEMSYVGRLDNFLTKALKNPVEEINQVCKELDMNIHIELEIKRGGKGGRQIQGIRFVCSELATEFKINKTDSKLLIDEKRELNKEILSNEKLKEKYKDIWAEIEAKVIEQNKDNPIFRKDGIFFDSCVFNYIRENLEK